MTVRNGNASNQGLRSESVGLPLLLFRSRISVFIQEMHGLPGEMASGRNGAH